MSNPRWINPCFVSTCLAIWISACGSDHVSSEQGSNDSNSAQNDSNTSMTGNDSNDSEGSDDGDDSTSSSDDSSGVDTSGDGTQSTDDGSDDGADDGATDDSTTGDDTADATDDMDSTDSTAEPDADDSSDDGAGGSGTSLVDAVQDELDATSGMTADELSIEDVFSSTFIGGRCLTEEHCGIENGVCITPDSDTWGDLRPPGGYCTTECDVDAADDPCVALDPTTACLQLEEAGPGYCMALCPRGSDNAEGKCRGRAELACVTDAAEVGICLPACGTDSECVTLAGPDEVESVLVCDVVTGTCQDGVTAEVGDACDPTDENAPCPCLPTSETEGFCSGICTFGSGAACGYTEAPYNVDCLLPLDASADADGVPLAGVGDAGLCLPTCNCSADCGPGTDCVFVDGGVEFSGNAGWCVPPADDDEILTECE